MFKKKATAETVPADIYLLKVTIKTAELYAKSV